MSHSLYDAFRPFSCLRKVPPGHSNWPDALLFLAKIAVGLGGRTGFISQIIPRWAAILWEGEIFHDLSEVNLVFLHFRCDWLEVFQGDASGYWFIISVFQHLGIGNAMWSVVEGWRRTPGGWAVSYFIHCINVVIIFVVGAAPVSGTLLCIACSCVVRIHSHGHMWVGSGFICFWISSKFFLSFLLNSGEILRSIASDYSTSAIFSSVLNITIFSLLSQ